MNLDRMASSPPPRGVAGKVKGVGWIRRTKQLACEHLSVRRDAPGEVRSLLRQLLREPRPQATDSTSSLDNFVSSEGPTLQQVDNHRVGDRPYRFH